MFKNRQNILLVVGIILFIGLYQYFVLSPYQAKHRASQMPPQGSAQQGSTPTPDKALVENNKRPLTAVAEESLVAAQALAIRGVVSTLQVGDERAIEVLEGAAIGRAVLTNYSVRNAAEKTPIVLNTEALQWTSNNAAIQNCLNGLTQQSVVQGNPGTLLMKSATAAGSCEFSLVPNPQHAGLLSSTLSLEGFATGQNDIIELKTFGTLGSDKQPDQNYLSYKMDDSIENIREKSVFENKNIRGRLSWMTWGDRYFSVIIKPTGSYSPDLSYGAVAGVSGKSNAEIPVSLALRYPAAPEVGKSRYDFSSDFYFGTRDPSVLNAIAPELIETVDLGFFASVARVMLWSLKSLNTFFHNFGVSIIALTLIVRLLFWPLNKKAYMSTIKMKELQPEMDRIRKKYDATDKSQAEKMNREIFGLYKGKKVNPLGGCLPMLLQLPIFIGLYGALNHSIDLYQAPFFGWLQDLSMHDPYYILPIVWTLSLLGYLQVNPQAMNTNQPGMPNMKWIMIGMNVFFGFLSKDWPSGLVLYLVVSNCVGLAQQYFLQRSSKKTLLVVKEGAL